MIKFIRIFLLVLIIIGLGLLATQKMWVPQLVERIVESESMSVAVVETPEQVDETQTPPAGLVVKDFEGEADPSRMTLDMTKWNWIRTTYKDGNVIAPKKPGVFTLELKKDKTFSARTDCNGVGGEYVVKDSKITFERMMSTMMYCEGSQESEFSGMLSAVESYKFTSKGELVLDLKSGSGSMIFR